MNYEQVQILIKSEIIDLVLDIMCNYNISIEELQKELKELED